MDFVCEMIAGTGPARRYSLERCRKELVKSCSRYQDPVDQPPPALKVRPCTSSAPDGQQPPPQKDKVDAQSFHPLHEKAHALHTSKKCPFQYTERELRHRTKRLDAAAQKAPEPLSCRPPVSEIDPFDGYTGSHFSSDFSVDDRGNRFPRAYSKFGPHPEPRRKPTREEANAIRDTAVRIARSCEVRDKFPYPNSPRQEVLHRIRSSVLSARVVNEDPAAQDDNGISITKDGCIVQRGFDVSPMTSSPACGEHARCDSGCSGIQDRTPRHSHSQGDPRAEPTTFKVRNRKGARIPVCFRKQEIQLPRTASNLSALLSNRTSTSTSADQDAGRRSRNSKPVPQQRLLPVFTRPVVIFGSSSSSGAILSDCDEIGSETELEDDKNKPNSATTSAVSFYDATEDNESDSDGKFAATVSMNKPAELSKTRYLRSQRSPPPTASQFKVPVHNSRLVKQDQCNVAGTPLPQPLPGRARLVFQRPVVDIQCSLVSNKPPKVERQNLRPLPQCSPRTQASKCQRLLRHQQPCLRPLPSHVKSPCHARFLPEKSPDRGMYIAALMAKIDDNGGRRPPNFEWNHVAPKHGMSLCTPYFVLN